MNHSTLTPQQADQIRATLAGMPELSRGVGTRENACSIAAINLALTGELTDDIPVCMSPTIGRWIIKIQDSMPKQMRNSERWRNLLPLAAGTGREREKERAAIALDWVWAAVLPQLQPLADKKGFGAEWRAMTTLKTAESAQKARRAADAAYAAYAAYAAAVAAADAAAAAAAADADAAAAAYAAAVAAAVAAVAYAAADAAAAAAAAADADAAAAAYAADAAARATFWASADPCGCLERMIGVES